MCIFNTLITLSKLQTIRANRGRSANLSCWTCSASWQTPVQVIRVACQTRDTSAIRRRPHVEMRLQNCQVCTTDPVIALLRVGGVSAYPVGISNWVEVERIFQDGQIGTADPVIALLAAGRIAAALFRICPACRPVTIEPVGIK